MSTDDEWVVAIIVFLILVILSAVLIAIRMRPRFKIGETDSDSDNIRTCFKKKKTPQELMFTFNHWSSPY